MPAVPSSRFSTGAMLISDLGKFRMYVFVFVNVAQYLLHRKNSTGQLYLCEWETFYLFAQTRYEMIVYILLYTLSTYK